MIPKDIIKKLRKIQITTSKDVMEVFSGHYQSVFKGSGLEFDEVREYLPGDEIRSIDWNVTARMGRPFMKKFVEERELTVIFILDVSMSTKFGTRNMTKNTLAAEVCSTLAFSAISNNDKVGMITFTDRVEKYIPPRKGIKHVMQIVREALYSKPEGNGTDINKVLEHFNLVTKRRAIVFLISDFMAPDFKDLLKTANRRHDLVAISVTDPSELSLPRAGIVYVHDAERGDFTTVNTNSRRIRNIYEERAKSFILGRQKYFQSASVDNIDLYTDKSYVEPLIKFFKVREKRRRRI
ncbi:MAG: DUF58 domain-containing protein [Candidatus Omnitrophica bacterium]|nr:DUF58 domain-containing protein [Candidatus Omnitrophota bacterium]